MGYGCHPARLAAAPFRLLQYISAILWVMNILLGPATAQDCTPITPDSGTTPLSGAVSIIKSGDYFRLFESWAAPAAGLAIDSFTSTGIEALRGAGIIIGLIDQIFDGNAVYNKPNNICWNVEGNYGFPDGRMISYPCSWGPFTAVNFKFGPTSPDADGWSQIGAEPSGIEYCLYAGVNSGDPLFTTNCNSSDDRQKFMFIPVGGPNFLFLHKPTLQCLHLASDGIRTTTCNVDDETQQFQWCNHLSQDCVEPSGTIFNPC